MQDAPIRILLIEDDEDDHILIRRLLSETHSRFQLDWVSTFDEGLKVLNEGRHDVYLLDYRLGEQNGLGLLRAAVEMGCAGPIIFLTGAGNYGLDMEAMRAGAADYLVKGQMTADLRAKQECERTFDTVPDLIAIIDRHFKIVRVNRAMADRMGVGPGEAVGSPCHDLIGIAWGFAPMDGLMPVYRVSFS